MTFKINGCGKIGEPQCTRKIDDEQDIFCTNYYGRSVNGKIIFIRVLDLGEFGIAIEFLDDGELP